MLLPHVCFLLSCFVVQRSAPLHVEHNFIFFLFPLFSCFGYTFAHQAETGHGPKISLLTAQRVCWCALWYNFGFSQPASSQSVLSQDPRDSVSQLLFLVDGFDLEGGRVFGCVNSVVQNCFPSNLFYLLSYSP